MKSKTEEHSFQPPSFMSEWSSKEKAEFAFQLLRTLPPSEVNSVIHRLSPYLHHDIIFQLPYEIALYIFSFLDSRSLAQASRVSKSWKAISEEQALWRGLFELHDWKYNHAEMENFLYNKPQEEDYDAASSGSSGNIAIVNQFSPVPIKRNTLFNHTKDRPLLSIKRQGKKEAGTQKIARHESNLEEAQAEHEVNGYDPISDTRFIDWKALYKNRFEIQKRWLSGSCKVEKFPPDSTRMADMHSEGIYCIQFDKHKLVTGSRDRTIKIWDLATATCKLQLSGHEGSVLCLQYDDRHVVSGSSDSTVIIFDIETGRVLRTLTGHQDSVLGIRIVKEKCILSCSKDRTLRLWDRDTGELIRVFQGHRAAVNAAQCKDNRIVSASGDRSIKIWDLDTGECLKDLTGHTRGVACVEFDGKHIVSGSSDQTIKVWDALTGECIYTLFGHTELVRAIQLDSAASLIISGCYNGQLKIWSLSEGRLIRDLGQATDGR
ncbi:WD40-repeat-containing domain protein [Gilbertella persicaria]|uniref:WD40-repeat-containing domain protein n=1 Tax=Gilbertella persicaria TaxID=101096 RepID=UPI002220CD80|nr:WD40-repeat-containing domain protein [Gilbertella persicaria]KAI8054926.1 WD40-repeat-containing domain protein [Gilbertella persicaria]